MTRHTPRGYPLTPPLIWKLRALMSEKGLSPKALPVTKRTWARWTSRATYSLYASGNPRQVRDSTVEALARCLAVPKESLIGGLAISFATLSRLAEEIDANVMKLTRSLSNVDVDSLQIAYHDHLNARLKEAGLTIELFRQLVEDAGLRDALVKTIGRPDLTVEVEKSLDWIHFRLPTARRLEVRSPQLLWDCHCGIPIARATKADCPIHSKKYASEVTNAFRSGLVLIRWNGLRFLWKNTPSLWPPSIDSFLMVSELARAFQSRLLKGRLLDVGSGTGFLGIAIAAARSSSLSRIDLADWLLTPALYGAVNYALNRGLMGGAECRLLVGLFPRPVSPTPPLSRYEILVCNPPYLPKIAGFEHLDAHSVVAGTDLLSYVVRKGPNLAEKVYVQFSHIADPDARSAAREAKRVLIPLGRKSQLVPFRVKDVWKIPDYLRALIRERRLTTKPAERYPYWHRIRLFQVAKLAARGKSMTGVEPGAIRDDSRKGGPPRRSGHERKMRM